MAGMASKQEYPPILPAGLHKMTAAELKQKVVGDFPRSHRRPALWSNFEWLLDALISVKLPCEIWVDGSFLTKKAEPDDIDLVVDVRVDRLKVADTAQADLLQKLHDLAYRTSRNLHSFVIFNAPFGHKSHPDSMRVHNQWAQDFGFAFVSKQPKGIAVVEVAP
jgi:hypothetical protein